MAFYTDLFSPETYEAFAKSDRIISGFRMSQHNAAQKICVGDKFICYMTKLSRWIGVLEVVSKCYVDDTPLFYPENDPFMVRFQVRPITWLKRDYCIPIHEDAVWDKLTFTKGTSKQGSKWTGIVRRSLNRMDDADGNFLEKLLLSQDSECKSYPVEDDKFRKLVTARIRRADKTVSVVVPEDNDDDKENECPEDIEKTSIRKSYQIQALLAQCGERMGFKIWLPKNDRTAVLQDWTPEPKSLIDVLPLNYDDTTLRTIEQIDVLWLKGRSIIRAFEVEHTTAVYSGILRMADLLALQPNMDIKLHIVAPEARKNKVFSEILRPVFSLLERAPLSESCTFISYDSLEELSSLKHIDHISDTVLCEYAEDAE